MLEQILLMSPQPGQSPLPSILLFGAMGIVFYFFMIRPQTKKAKEQRNFMENLQKGDKIVTIAGMHGRITKLNDNGTVEVEIDNNVKIVMEKSGISQDMSRALNKDAAPAKK